MSFSYQTDLTRPTLPPTPFYRDARVLAVFAQLVFLLVLVLLAAFLYNNVTDNLQAKGRTFSWNFLSQTAGFEIAEGPAFASSDSYLRAFVVGAINTLRVALVGILLATLLGLATGIARLSNNWLLRTVASVYIEIMRNTPLLVQLFFWYFAVVLALPDIKAHLTIPGLAFLSNRGAQLTWLFITQTGDALWYWLLGGVLISALTAWLDRRRLRAQGKLGGGFLAALTAFVIVAIIGYGVTSVTATLPDAIRFDLKRGDRGTLYVDGNNNGKYDKNIDTPMRHVPIRLLAEDGSELGQTFTNDEGAFLFFDLGEKKGASVTWQTPPPVVISQPRMQGFNLVGGLSIKPEYFGLLLGLVIYTAAFIAEIVRAGINSVPKGQWEAARALGLRQTEILRMIVLPQALRVAIPPMTSQFLNLTKNSSLAVAVGYPDMFGVSQTIVNQSGAELQVILMLMATYLFFSLTTSTFTNWYNRRVTLKER